MKQRKPETKEIYIHPMKLQKFNIVTKDNLKMVSIGIYWDEETISKIKSLLNQCEHLFPNNFIELKGIKGDFGEMKIALKMDVKLINQRPQRPKTHMKQKMKIEVESMLSVG